MPKKLTRVEMETKLRETQNERDNLFLALNDVLAGKVTWFRKGNVKMGISRPDSGSGGIFILDGNSTGYAAAYLWDEIWAKEKDYSAPSNDKDLINYRNCMLEVYNWVQKQRALTK